MKSKFLYSLAIFISFFTFSFGGLKLKPKSYEALLNFIREPFDEDALRDILTFSDVSLACSKGFFDLYDNENYYNAKQLFDSWSALPSGLLAGQTTSFGSFDECEGISLVLNRSDVELRGRYSVLMASISTTDSNNEMQRTDLFSFGVCLPSPCKALDIEEIFTIYFGTAEKLFDLFGLPSKGEKYDNLQTNFAVYKNEDNISEEDTFAAGIGIVVFSFIGILVISSTYMELISNKFNAKIDPLWKSFSVVRNGNYLFDISSKNSLSPNMIECLNGVRALSLIWNVYGHTYLWIVHKPDVNEYLLVETFRSTYSSVLMAAHLSVDSFLLLSGLLITWTGLNRMNKRNGKINVKLMYLHRYLRLTPSYAATILFAAGLYVFFGSGPLWYENTLYLSKTCQDYWWRSLFYISNYFSFSEMCLGHSWFLAVDMQLFLFSPFILMGLWKWPKKMCAILVFLSILSTFLVFVDILSIGEQGFEMDEATAIRESAFDRAHFRTELSASPWIIGVILGYLLFQQRHRKRTPSKLKLAVVWALWIFILMAVLFVPQHFTHRNLKPSLFVSALYEALGHFGWALVLAWIIYSCYMGYSQAINSFLSHPIWLLITKLNYTIYLVKTFMNINNLALQKSGTFYSHYAMTAEFWSDFGISSCFAVLLSLTVELPFMALENHFLSNAWLRY